MFEIQILIPIADNDGTVFAAAHHAAFEAFAAELFGGITRLPRSAAGVWVQDGKVFRDGLRVYAFAIPSIIDGAKVGTLAEFAKAHYRQLAVYIRYLTLAEVL